MKPETVYRSHRVWITLEGSGFKQKVEVRTLDYGHEVLETRLESNRKLRVLVRIADGEEDAELRLTVESGPGRSGEPLSLKILACPISGMTVVPAGSFRFGSNEGSEFERPEKEIELPTFACNLREINNLEYLEFLNYMQQHGDHSRCHPDEDPLKSHIPNGWADQAIRSPYFPVTGVDWYDAYAYGAWRGWRLPTEEGWEKAARGTEGAPFPWGNEPDQRNANTSATKAGLRATYDFPTGRSPYGLFNAAGNVWEWTASSGPQEGKAIIRGGSYLTDLQSCRTFIRNWLDRRDRRNDLGFRCVADI